MSINLLADRRLTISETEYPNLRLSPIEDQEVLNRIRRVAPTDFVYNVSPNGFCGCYFKHETPEMFARQIAERDPNTEYATTPEQAEAMWRGQTSALKSFARYLSDHANAKLAVYVVWEGQVGQKEPTCAFVPPSYFDAPGFESLPEDLLLDIIPEDGEWDSNEPRAHEWLSCA